MVGITKHVLRKLMDKFPTSFWDDFIPEVKVVLRHSVTTSHCYKPAEVAYKQAVQHLCALLLEPPSIITEDAVEASTDSLAMDWELASHIIKD